ncbi:ribosomal protein S9/S16-domain-containing protein [Kockovaella imperatae]|uniref:Ribosomal protein S9/S16-domain-containing protein n=1 Tax=Kockovaella imperatae TaxID=4999 RepID=A0A1Y1UK47_9TREE|nr:ribosomal protein S9/S16-domain-containing protein [Kockovaella imperatae]ORX38369.1 ribosomal protein S9/S16-domain-containing protein [Kockovaella imperatae]
MSSSLTTFSRQSLRSLRAGPSKLSVRAASTAQSTSSTPAYQPQSYSRRVVPSDQRPPRPTEPTFFTGTPLFYNEVTVVRNALKQVEMKLREDKVWPLPNSLEVPNYVPPIAWVSVEKMNGIIGGTQMIKRKQYREMIDILSDLNKMSYVARLAGRADLSKIAENAMSKWIASRIVKETNTEAGSRMRGSIDTLGRAVGHGKRKTAMASVWIVPVKEAIPYFEGTVPVSKKAAAAAAAAAAAPASDFSDIKPFIGPDGSVISFSASSSGQSTFDPKTAKDLPVGQIIINQLPLPLTFEKHQDRETILRPLRLTGLIGAYNIFGLVKGGGITGQAGAVSLAIARALTAIRPEVEPTLFAAGLLIRDPRMVERKKTNLLGARTRRTWVKR